jgi:hypothetical protein
MNTLQSNVTEAVRGAIAAGLNAVRIEVGRDGRFAIVAGAVPVEIENASKSEAVALLNRNRYASGVSCKRGHMADRYISNGCCIVCARETKRAAAPCLHPFHEIVELRTPADGRSSGLRSRRSGRGAQTVRLATHRPCCGLSLAGPGFGLVYSFPIQARVGF